MAYRALIRKYIDKAFNMLKDIPMVVTFKKHGGRTFNFSTGKASELDEAQSINVKVVILSGERKSKDSNIIFKRLIVRHDLIATIMQYDVVEINGEEWIIDDFVKSDVDFVEFIEIHRDITEKEIGGDAP